MKLHRYGLLLGMTAALAINQLQAQVPAEAAPRADMIALGKAHATAEELYAALKKMAGKDIGISSKLPDWSGIYSVDLSKGFAFDNAQKPNEPPTAKLTPEYQARLDKKLALIKKGIDFDPLGRCDPPGLPRWFQEPFLRDYVVTPAETWMMTEVGNVIRRIYTDGREHYKPEDRFPTWDGDSIGFWSGNKLVVHTDQLHEGPYQRDQPDYSDQVELVEIWQKTDDKTLDLHIWAYDPVALREPWYAHKRYLKVTNADKSVRIHYWHCLENQNNNVIETPEGGTSFEGSGVKLDDKQ